MEDDILPVAQGSDKMRIAHVAGMDRNLLMNLRVDPVEPPLTAEGIVERQRGHLRARVDQGLNKVAADEPIGARHKYGFVRVIHGPCRTPRSIVLALWPRRIHMVTTSVPQARDGNRKGQSDFLGRHSRCA